MAGIPVPREQVLEALRTAQAVCLDVDSTVSPDEGIDVLSSFAGVSSQVAEITRSAMEGHLPFHAALIARLELIRPSQEMLARCLKAHPPSLNPGVLELVQLLQAQGTHVYLVSGGFEPLILPLAAQLGIPASKVFANVFHFDADGGYAGFDLQRPTAQAGGKAAVLLRLKRLHGYFPLIMIGDGATDLEARPPADYFVGFGGVVVREKVRREADWFITDFTELVEALRA
jgi:phosphoserine phosphatase